MDQCKACNLCGEKKSPEEFYRNAGTKDGLGSCCKRCSIDKARRARLADPERARRHDRAYRARNLEKVRAKGRARYWRDVEASRERSRAWAAANRDYFKAWRADHDACMKAHYKAKRAKRLQVLVGSIDVVAIWDGRCGICGLDLDPNLRFPDRLSKSIDHIVPLARGGTHTQDNVQWAHLGCNSAKGARLAP